MQTVTINLLFFGSLKSHFGVDLCMLVPIGTNLATIFKILQDKKPDAAEILKSCQIAVDSELETKDFIIVQSSEVAILPPFSGG